MSCFYITLGNHLICKNCITASYASFSQSEDPKWNIMILRQSGKHWRIPLNFVVHRVCQQKFCCAQVRCCWSLMDFYISEFDFDTSRWPFCHFILVVLSTLGITQHPDIFLALSLTWKLHNIIYDSALASSGVLLFPYVQYDPILWDHLFFLSIVRF